MRVPPRSFATAAEAAKHARSARHLAARCKVAERLVRLLQEGVEAVVPRPEALADAALEARVREHDGLARLWAAGLHPDDVAAWPAR